MCGLFSLKTKHSPPEESLMSLVLSLSWKFLGMPRDGRVRAGRRRGSRGRFQLSLFLLFVVICFARNYLGRGN